MMPPHPRFIGLGLTAAASGTVIGSVVGIIPGFLMFRLVPQWIFDWFIAIEVYCCGLAAFLVGLCLRLSYRIRVNILVAAVSTSPWLMIAALTEDARLFRSMGYITGAAAAFMTIGVLLGVRMAWTTHKRMVYIK